MGSFVPSDWTPVGGFAFKTRDILEATRIFGEIDGLTGAATEGRQKGVEWMSSAKFREKMIEAAQQRTTRNGNA